MEEFFAAEEHQALEEPMVVECAKSAPVSSDRIVIRAPRARRARFKTLYTFEARYIRPARTGPPQQQIPPHGAYRVIGGAVSFSIGDASETLPT